MEQVQRGYVSSKKEFAYDDNNSKFECTMQGNTLPNWTAIVGYLIYDNHGRLLLPAPSC